MDVEDDESIGSMEDMTMFSGEEEEEVVDDGSDSDGGVETKKPRLA